MCRPEAGDSGHDQVTTGHAKSSTKRFGSSRSNCTPRKESSRS